MRREGIEEYARRKFPHVAGVRRCGTLDGEEAWAPTWGDLRPALGLPLFIMVRGESIRTTSGEEGLAILHRLNEQRRT